ncbi:hypothetical protein AB0I10_37375 [Streptomyces sp. NPDC050636]|uniref:hypothetical protein n=1 Tax=Streptomyces sp. NPDC050636 TaxID=3154510 RepID=UPI003435B819
MTDTSVDEARIPGHRLLSGMDPAPGLRQPANKRRYLSPALPPAGCLDHALPDLLKH